jgi:hypothetical protein
MRVIHTVSTTPRARLAMKLDVRASAAEYELWKKSAV